MEIQAKTQWMVLLLKWVKLTQMRMYQLVIDTKSIKSELLKVWLMPINSNSKYHSSTSKTESMYKQQRTI